MKYLTAIVLAFLLAIPVGLIAAPHNTAKASYTVTPFLFVFPEQTNITGPCQKGKTFTIDVWLLNIDMLAKNDVYAFDFWLDWSTILGDDLKPIIGLVNDSITVHSPWPAGGYFVVKNETSPVTETDLPTSDLPAGTPISSTRASGYPYTDYHLSITAIPPKGAGLWDVNQSVVTLTFVVLQDACWPNAYGFNGVNNGFVFTYAAMSGDGTKAVPISGGVEGGQFYESPSQPNIDLVDAEAKPTNLASLGIVQYDSPDGTTQAVTEKCASHETDVEIDLTNITKVYGYGFELAYDPTHKEIDLQKTSFKPGFPPPYEWFTGIATTTTASLAWYGHLASKTGDALSMFLYYNGLPTGTGLLAAQGSGGLLAAIDVICIRPSEKPTICGTKVPIFDVIFHEIDLADQWAQVSAEGFAAWLTGSGLPMLNTKFASPMEITMAFVLAKSCGPSSIAYEYDYASSNTILDASIPTGVPLEITNVDNGGFVPASFVPAGYAAAFKLPNIGGRPWDPSIGNAGYTVLGLVYGNWEWYTTGEWVGNLGIGTVNTGQLYYAPPVTSTGHTYPQYLGNYYGVGFGLVYNDIYNYFKPSKYDLNLDCVVDIQDLMALLPYYGMSPIPSTLTTTWANLYAGTTIIVDIFDFVAIAKNFGPVDP